MKKHSFQLQRETIDWGGVDQEVATYKPFTQNAINKIPNKNLKRDAIFLGMLAYAGISGHINYYFHREVKIESWGLPDMVSPFGCFFGCPLRETDDPASQYSRIVVGGSKDAREYTQNFSQ